jgi:DNA-binding NarL/FixJ family response regulator
MAKPIMKEKDQIVVLLKSQGKTFREIGQILNLHWTTVHERFYRIIGKKKGKKLSPISARQLVGE